MKLGYVYTVEEKKLKQYFSIIEKFDTITIG